LAFNIAATHILRAANTAQVEETEYQLNMAKESVIKITEFSKARLYSEGIEQLLRQLTLSSRSRSTPQIEVNHQIESGLTLVHFRFDEKAVRLDKMISVTFRWLREENIDERIGAINIDGWEFSCHGREILQKGLVKNLAPNGGFETPWEGIFRQIHPEVNDQFLNSPYLFSGYTLKYGSSVQQIGEEAHRIVPEECFGEVNHVFALNNYGEQAENTGIASPILGACAGKKFLLGCWIKTSVDARALLGMRWWPLDGKHAEFTYIFSNLSSSENWEYRYGVLSIPSNVIDCKIWFLNWGTKSQVFFDDVLALELPVDALRKFIMKYVG
jgi:hypothetical protein